MYLLMSQSVIRNIFYKQQFWNWQYCMHFYWTLVRSDGHDFWTSSFGSGLFVENSGPTLIGSIPIWFSNESLEVAVLLQYYCTSYLSTLEPPPPRHPFKTPTQSKIQKNPFIMRYYSDSPLGWLKRQRNVINFQTCISGFDLNSGLRVETYWIAQLQ